MPRFTVHVRDEWLTVSCRDPGCTVQRLGLEALRRYAKNKPDNGGIGSAKDTRFVARRCQGLGLLDPDDAVEDVLEENDFVELVIEGDTMSPDFIPSQPAPSHLNSAYREPHDYLLLDGNGLTSADLVNLGKGLYKIKLTPEAENKVVQSRELLDTIVKENKVVYGITTGFGKFARTVIPVSKLKDLQENLVRSHSAGLGSPLSPERTRMLLALRINVLAKGHSGISLDTLHAMIQAFNASCLSYVPEKGTVGASGDLAPLSHLALGLMGEGKMWSPKSGWADAKYVLEAHGLKPVSLRPKEGLALINGTQMITSLGAEAVERAEAIARQADIIAALTLEVLKGTTKAFDSDIHKLRPHPGQIQVALRFRALLDSDHHPSEIAGRLHHAVLPAGPRRGQRHHRIREEHHQHGDQQRDGQPHGVCGARRDHLWRELSRGISGQGPRLPVHRRARAGVHQRAADRAPVQPVPQRAARLPGERGRAELRVHDRPLHRRRPRFGEQGAVPPVVRGLPVHQRRHRGPRLHGGLGGQEGPAGGGARGARPWIKDRFMAPDIEAIHRLLLDQKIWNIAKPYIDKYRMEHIPESRPSSPTAFSLESPGSPRKRVRHE
ncbi:histidine ammonia-lyase-like isoform X2 [Denticeps clupeoides]|uniref:histidine ammonia-lyase-like isoform X2 n=1 Tax=Denticeps clupeoides TaxID=299321 RepID=UPI0010A50667|nr:histidine ammonia-lyase-like isoform X2 [Denticeps clupeoides]